MAIAALILLFSMTMGVLLSTVFPYLMALLVLRTSQICWLVTQAMFFVSVWPLSKNTYRIIDSMIKELYLMVPLFFIHWCAGFKIQVYADHETMRLMGKEHAFVISNSGSDADWFIQMILAERSGCLGSILGIFKNSLKYIPITGWSVWLSECIFLGSCAEDGKKFKSDLQGLKDFVVPFWLCFSMDDTYSTQAELLAPQRLTVPSNVSSSHTKEFAPAVRHVRSFVPAIYDMTVANPETLPPLKIERLLEWKPCVVHVHIKRHATEELPEPDDAVEQWCKDKFLAKDALLDRHRVEQTFGDQELQVIGRPLKPLLVVLSWAFALVYNALMLNLVHWCTLLVFSVSLYAGRIFPKAGMRFQRYMETALRSFDWSGLLIRLLDDFIQSCFTI